MSDITDDIALGGSFGNVGEDQVQTIPTNPVGPEPTELRTVTNDSSLGSAFGQNGSPEAITATSEAAQSAIQAAISEENALASATASASSATASAASATESASSASTSSSEASAAAASAAAALVSENNAEDSETNASASETSAATDAASATASATSATASATSASTSAIAAAASETSAASSATSSQTSATNAATSETNAATSETNAATAETNAGVSATAAATSATVAATSATSAATSASSATASANSATTQAEIAFNNAATSAYEASLSAASATAAATSEANASTSATTASTAATNSATSATNSATSATNSATSATNAATSETNAATSATNAALSATSAETAETNAEAAESNAATSAATATTKASEAVTSASSASTSASTATTKASEAATSATNAATSESNASSSATAAAASETNAATSETNAATSATNAATSASSASTSATNAGTSATAAATSETNASSSELAASGSATDAANSATASAASATASATSATNSAGSAAASLTAQSASEAARDAALAAFDSFDDRYLGQKTADPTTDNDGDALVAGTLYFNTTSDIMKVYEGTQWVAAYASLSGALIATYNLSDLTDTNAARTNLGLGTIATAGAEDYLLSTGGIVTGTIEAPLFEGDLSGAQLFPAKAGEAITKGDALYISGISGNKPIVMKANASDFTKMPSFGVSQTTVSANASVNCVTYGQLHNIDTTPFSLGDQLYVSTTSGGLTATAPAGETSLIQNLGKVERVHESTGALFIAGAGRANATPNLDSGNFFLGNGSNQAVSADFDTSVTNIALPLAGGALTGAVTTTSTFDGRDVSVDGAKLDGIETNATADQTVSEIKTAYESNANTNAFTDADHTKLDGIAANANNYVLPFTDNSTNWNTAYSWGDHAIAGYLPSSSYTASDVLTKIKTVDGSGSGLDADLLDGQQGSYYAPASHNHQALGGFGGLTEYTILDGPGNGPVWKVRWDGATSNRYWDLGFKDGYGTFYTGLKNYNNATLKWVDNTLWHAGNDGSGSGLDADLLDGYNTSVSGTANTIPIRTGNGDIAVREIQLNSGLSAQVPTVLASLYPTTNQLVRTTPAAVASSMGAWTSSNDGSGSGLDADLLDGVQGTDYFRCDGTYPNTNMNSIIEGYWHIASNSSNTPVNNYGHRWDYDHLNNGQWAFQMYSPTSGSDDLWIRQMRNHVTQTWHKVWTTGNDGSGSGLDADLLDGQQGSYYYPASNPSGYQTTSGSVAQSEYVSGSAFATTGSPSSVLEYQQNAGQSDTRLAPSTDWHNSIRMGHGNPYNYYSNTIAIRMTGGGSGTMFTQHISNNTPGGWRTQWDSANDGSGSGLDADLLDGQQPSALSVNYANSAGSVSWGNVSSKPSYIMTYAGFTLDANGMGGNTTGFTYANNAPAVGPIVRFSTGGNYDMWLNAPYSGGGNHLYFRTRNGDNGTLNAWKQIWHAGNDGSGSGLDADTVDGVQASLMVQLSNTQTITGQKYFRSDRNTTSNSPPLQAYSGNASGAIMAFHRGGHYAINMGLDSDNWFRIGGWSAATNRLQMDMSGNLTMAGNITAYSDIRLKENIKVIPDALSKVQQLRGVTFTRNDTEDLEKLHTGVIAQEVEAVLPEAVSEDNDGIKNVAYGNMVGLLIESIKELKAEVDDLKTQLENK